MKSRLKSQAFVVLAVLISASLAGCGAGAPTQAPAEADQKPGVTDGTVTQAEE